MDPSVLSSLKDTLREAISTFGRAVTYTPYGGAPVPITIKIKEGLDRDSRPPEGYDQDRWFGQARGMEALVHADDLSGDPVAGFENKEWDVILDDQGTKWAVRGFEPFPKSVRGVAWLLYCSTDEAGGGA